ncbi:MAG: hypothetical protein JWM86_833 [Thermoleophilia bacterium]|nr:hypothetical protein [Thermoleophilia bacterium]
MTTLALVAVVGAVVASLLHVVFFVLESLRFRDPATWRRFGVASQEHADAIAPMAFNQGFYNLFLALGTLVGAAVLVAGDRDVGWALMLFGCSTMVGAALVLAATSRDLLRAAVLQGAPPLLCIGAALSNFT